MKRTIALPLILLATIVVATAFTAAAQKVNFGFRNRNTEPKTFPTANEHVLADIKNILEADNAKVTHADSVLLTAEMPNFKWAWEKKDGSPDNKTAIVVISKQYDIGANRIKKPKSVTTSWVVTLAEDKKSYTIKLENASSIYPKDIKANTGYSTALYEEKIAGLVK